MGILCVDLGGLCPKATDHLVLGHLISPGPKRHPTEAGGMPTLLGTANATCLQPEMVSVPWLAGDSSVRDGFSGVPQRELQM